MDDSKKEVQKKEEDPEAYCSTNEEVEQEKEAIDSGIAVVLAAYHTSADAARSSTQKTKTQQIENTLDAAATAAAAVINAATATLTTAAATPTTTTTAAPTTTVTAAATAETNTHKSTKNQCLQDVLLTANTDAKVEAEASKREAKNIRACVECHKAKVKYVVDENATRCRRCTRLNTECIPHHSKQGQGPRKRRRKEKLPPPNKSRTEETLTSSTMEAAVPGVTGIPNRTAAVGEMPAAATMSSTTTTTMPSSSDRVDVADLSSFSTTEVTISHREV